MEGRWARERERYPSVEEDILDVRDMFVCVGEICVYVGWDDIGCGGGGLYVHVNV